MLNVGQSDSRACGGPQGTACTPSQRVGANFVVQDGGRRSRNFA